MTAPEHILDHAARAFGRLGQEFQEMPDWRPLANVVAKQIQDLEDVFWDLLTKRWLDGEGAQLDQLGNLLSEPREGFADDQYLERLKAKILILRSSGSAPHILKIFKRLLPDNTIRFTQIGGAGFILDVGTIDPAFAGIYSRFARQAASAGINAQLIFDLADDFQTFFTDFGSIISSSQSSGATSLPLVNGFWFAAGDLVCLEPGTTVAELRVVSAATTTKPGSITVPATSNAHGAGAAASVLAHDGGFATLSSLAASGQPVLAFASGHPFTTGDVTINPHCSGAETKTILSTTSTSVTLTTNLANAHASGQRVIPRLRQGWSSLANPTYGGALSGIIT